MTLPLFYYAVRDPSAVRVVPVKGRAQSGGPAHVSLVFPLAGLDAGASAAPTNLSAEEIEAFEAVRTEADRNTQGAFIVTIGLKKHQERAFFERVVLEPPHQPFSGLCENIRKAAGDLDS